MSNFVLNALVILPIAIAVTSVVFVACWRRNVHASTDNAVAKVGRGQIVSAVVISGVLLALVVGATIVMVSSSASVMSIIQGL